MSIAQPLAALFLLSACASAWAVDPARVDALAAELESKVVAWRHDIHQNPELSDQEVRTAALVADHLEGLGYEVKRGVARHGLVAVLGGGSPVVALRADMDALPVVERTGLPYASTKRTTYLGKEVGVMHACGHDSHVAILMGVAEVLARLDPRPAGTVKLLFQPAEEGVPDQETWGARLMVEEGALNDPRPDAVLALHATSLLEAGQVGLSPGPSLASSDRLRIVIRGRQTHGALPWFGVDPVVTAAQVVMALQTVATRSADLTRGGTVISIGKITGGERGNIIPDEVEMIGTIRALDTDVQDAVHRRIEEVVSLVAASAGAEADVEIRKGYPVTVNDVALTARVQPVLERVLGADRVITGGRPSTGAEDFSFFAREVPGAYMGLGVRSPDLPLEQAAPNHSPLFLVDDAALLPGMRVLLHITLDLLTTPPGS